MQDEREKSQKKLHAFFSAISKLLLYQLFMANTARFDLLFFPPLDFFTLLLQHETAFLERNSRYQKQAYQNRCYILGANGVQALNVPVQSGAWRLPTEEVQLAQKAEVWARPILQALRSAYGKAPFFEELFPELEALLLRGEPENLAALNQKTLTWCLDLLQFPTKIHFCKEFETSETNAEESKDYRRKLHPRKARLLALEYPAYYQAFGEAFLPNLSILDLLLNEGVLARDYLLRAAANAKI